MEVAYYDERGTLLRTVEASLMAAFTGADLGVLIVSTPNDLPDSAVFHIAYVLDGEAVVRPACQAPALIS